LPGEESMTSTGDATDDDDDDDDDEDAYDDDCQDKYNFLELQTTSKLNDRALLPPVAEGGGAFPTEARELSDLEMQLMAEKQKLANRLYAMRRGYDGRVGPFRDVFDDVSNLRRCTCRRLASS
jgi:hypothetical protein